MCMSVCTYECHLRYVAACRDQKRQFGPLELELQVVRSLSLYNAGNQAQVLFRSGECSDPPSHLSSPKPLFHLTCIGSVEMH